MAMLFAAATGRRREEGPPECMMDCEFPHTEEEWMDGVVMCPKLQSFAADCATDCDEYIMGHIEDLTHHACEGEWPPHGPNVSEEEEDVKGASVEEEEHEKEEEHHDEMPECLLDCYMDFDHHDAHEMCENLHAWQETGCLDDCGDDVQEVVHHKMDNACYDAEAEETLEEDFEHEHHHSGSYEEEDEHDAPPECLQECPGYPFDEESLEAIELDGEDADQVCDFIGTNFECTSPCDQMIRDFIWDMRESACAGDWPMDHEEDDKHACVENCVEPCFHPTFTACWDPLWSNCWDSNWEDCYSEHPDQDACHDYTHEICEHSVMDECQQATIEACLPDCLHQCGVEHEE